MYIYNVFVTKAGLKMALFIHKTHRFKCGGNFSVRNDLAKEKKRAYYKRILYRNAKTLTISFPYFISLLQSELTRFPGYLVLRNQVISDTFLHVFLVLVHSSSLL